MCPCEYGAACLCHTICVLCFRLGNVYLSSLELGFEKMVTNFIKNFPCQRPNQLVGGSNVT